MSYVYGSPEYLVQVCERVFGDGQKKEDQRREFAEFSRKIATLVVEEMPKSSSLVRALAIREGLQFFCGEEALSYIKVRDFYRILTKTGQSGDEDAETDSKQVAIESYAETLQSWREEMERQGKLKPS